MSPLPWNQLELDELSGVKVERGQGGLVLGETAPLDLKERAHERLVFQPRRRALGCERPSDARVSPRVRLNHGRTAPGLNGYLKGCDRSLVFGGEPQDLVVVADGLVDRQNRTVPESRDM